MKATYYSVTENDFRTYSESDLWSTFNVVKDSAEQSFDEMLAKLTPSKRKLVLAAIELYKRKEAPELDKVNSSRDIYRYLFPVLGELVNEEFWVIYLNQANRIIKRVRISVGAISETAVDIRLVLRNGIMCCASGIIVSHNHPSGNTQPSNADNMFTQKLKEAARFMDIRVLDHVIIGGDSYYSYADEGKI